MNINILKYHFFKYISRAEYMTAISIVFGSIVTTLLSSYSNYLDDRNNRIKRLNEKPLNNIYVDYITYEEYQRIIDKKNWKPSSLRPKQEEENAFKKEKLLQTVNKWLANQVRKKTLESEVNQESLRKLVEFNNNQQTQFEINKQYNNTINDPKNTNSAEILNTAEQDKNFTQINKKANNSLPPERKKLDTYSNQNKRHLFSNFFSETSEQDKKIVGKIAGKDIKKDANIFDSLRDVWRTIFFYEKKQVPVKKYHHEYGKKNKTTNKKYKNINSQTNDNISNVENVENVDSNLKHSDNFLIPTFVIDGNLQEMDKYIKFQKIASNNNTNTNDLKMLAYLEYTIEKCWHDKYKINYQNNPIDAVILVTYTKDAEISDIKIDNLINISDETSSNFIRDVANMLSSCKITNIKNLTKKNYNLWGKLKIKFNTNKITK